MTIANRSLRCARLRSRPGGSPVRLGAIPERGRGVLPTLPAVSKIRPYFKRSVRADEQLEVRGRLYAFAAAGLLPLDGWLVAAHVSNWKDDKSVTSAAERAPVGALRAAGRPRRSNGSVLRARQRPPFTNVERTGDGESECSS